jgi:hypothetical protein
VVKEQKYEKHKNEDKAESLTGDVRICDIKERYERSEDKANGYKTLVAKILCCDKNLINGDKGDHRNCNIQQHGIIKEKHDYRQRYADRSRYKSLFNIKHHAFPGAFTQKGTKFLSRPEENFF